MDTEVNIAFVEVEANHRETSSPVDELLIQGDTIAEVEATPMESTEALNRESHFITVTSEQDGDSTSDVVGTKPKLTVIEKGDSLTMQVLRSSQVSNVLTVTTKENGATAHFSEPGHYVASVVPHEVHDESSSTKSSSIENDSGLNDSNVVFLSMKDEDTNNNTGNYALFFVSQKNSTPIFH